MKKTRELAWWVEFGQIDFGNYRDRAKRNWREDFETKMNKYQSGGPLDFDILLRKFNFEACKTQAEKIMRQIKKVIKNPDLFDGVMHDDFLLDVSIELRFMVSSRDKTFISSPGGASIENHAVPILFYDFLDRVNFSDFKQCKYSKCDDIFFPFTTKNKQYCSRRCATLAGHARGKK